MDFFRTPEPEILDLEPEVVDLEVIHPDPEVIDPKVLQDHLRPESGFHPNPEVIAEVVVQLPFPEVKDTLLTQ